MWSRLRHGRRKRNTPWWRWGTRTQAAEPSRSILSSDDESLETREGRTAEQDAREYVNIPRRRVYSPSDSKSNPDPLAEFPEEWMRPNDFSEGADRILTRSRSKSVPPNATLGSTLTGTQLAAAEVAEVGRQTSESAQFWAEREARLPNVKRYNTNWGDYMLRRILTDARSVAEYVASVPWKDNRNWAEGRVLAAVMDDLMAEFGAEKVRNSQGCESALRRIEALRVGDQTGNWDIADNDMAKLNVSLWTKEGESAA